MKAVIYARYSSSAQTEQSIEGQIRVCKEYAERHNINIINEYIDRALTGTNDNRPEFQQMIEDAEKKEFEQIIVYKLDRFSRNKYDNVVYKHKLAQFGVKVVSATEVISDTPEGAVMEGLLEMFAEMYSKDLSQKVKRGIRESILKGNYIGGHILYGYKVIDKKIVIDENTAPAIRYLFEEYANGKSKKQIVKELNDKGYRINNKPISYNSFQNNLKNKKYAGIFDNGTIQNENYYPAIISVELFEQVQLKLNERKHAPAKEKAKIEYLLTGKAFCGHCGASMVGTAGTGRHGTRYHYYSCSKHWKENSCNKRNEKKDELEKYVVEQTLNYILTPEQMENIANGMLSEWEKDKTTSQIKEYKNKINELEKELNKCFDLFFNATSEEIQKRLNEKANSIQLHRDTLQEELTKLELAKRITHSKEDILEALGMYLDGDSSDINYQRKIINKFVNSVYIFDDKIAIYYNLFNLRKFTYEEAIENIKQNESVLISNGTLRHNLSNKNTDKILVFLEDIFGLIAKRK